MRSFEYRKPKTLDDVFSLLDQYGGGALPIAGGTDLIVMLKKRALAPDVLVSLKGITELSRIEYGRSVMIGSTVTHRSIERSTEIRKRFSALGDAEDVLGSVQIRNVGTIGGNICSAVPSADTAPPLLVLDAMVRARSRRGEREIPLETFFTEPGKTVLDSGEIITAFTLPEPLPHSASAYWKHQRRLALDIPIVGVAVQLSLDRGNLSCANLLRNNVFLPEALLGLAEEKLVCKHVRIALGVAAPTPMRAWNAERVMQGQVITSELIDEAARTASEEAKPRDSIRGEAWYRREMIRVFVKRMILRCVERIAE